MLFLVKIINNNKYFSECDLKIAYLTSPPKGILFRELNPSAASRHLPQGGENALGFITIIIKL
jgi:hypothetical protein